MKAQRTCNIEKAQISIEYLILIAAVLAIVALVVAMVTNIFKGNQNDLQFQMCRQAAASCALLLKNDNKATCSSCADQCKDVRDNTDILSKQPIATACADKNSACGLCMKGKANDIKIGAIYAPSTGGTTTGGTTTGSSGGNFWDSIFGGGKTDTSIKPPELK